MKPHHPSPKTCHFDRRDGAFCSPGAEKSLLDFGFQAQIILPPCLPASSNKDNRFVMLNNSLTCWLALMI